MDALDKLPLPLLEWYRDNARVLPWRSDPTPYHVWVSEIMLQQTRVAEVLDYYKRFLEALPTVNDLAACDEDRLMKLWQGLGYYSRARNLQKAARTIVEEHGGVFSGDYQSIRGLAGVGDYTAGAIASIAFGLPVPAVDGNVLRVVSRLTADGRDVTRPEVKTAVGQALQAVMPLDCPGDFNQALMELGATVCLPNGLPLCDRCPARDLCAAHRAGAETAYPVKPPKKERRVEERRVWLIFYEKKVALRRRPDKGLLAGLWEFPNESENGQKIKKMAKSEEFFTYNSVQLLDGSVQPAGTGRHVFTHIEWHMTAYTALAATDALPPGWVWADRNEWKEKYSIPSAFSSFEHILDRYM